MEAAEGPFVPPPLKTIVPLLEDASREEPNDNYMLDLWSNLLMNSFTEASVPPRFPSIVAELTALFEAVSPVKLDSLSVEEFI
jgi:hypothetical protein